MAGDYPITDICIVSDKTRCPAGYTAISRASDDSSLDTDLWKDSLFSFSRIYRYICISKSPPQSSLVCNVIADLTLINDREFIPTGYAPIEFTMDSKEKALRKKVLCVKVVPREFAVDAVCDFIILARQKNPPHGYTKAGELEGLVLCYKYGVIPTGFPNNMTPKSSNNFYPNLPYPIHPLSHSSATSNGKTGTPTRQTPETPTGGFVSGQQGSPNFHTPTKRQMSVVSNTGIEGLPFEINPKIRPSKNRNNLPNIKPISQSDYEYDFSLESSILVNAFG